MPTDPADLVIDLPDDFRVHSNAYISPDIFELEMQRIFERSWVYVAHESQIPEPGDFMTTRIGTQPVIVSARRPRRPPRPAQPLPPPRFDRLPARVGTRPGNSSARITAGPMATTARC